MINNLKYKEKPKFIHNLWMRSAENPDVTYLTSLQGIFEVSSDDAAEFMKFRTYCNGHNTIPEISIMSGVSEHRIKEVVDSFDEINIIRPNEYDLSICSDKDVLDKLENACIMWGEQLHDTHIFNEFISGNLSFMQFQGFLLEMYHYLKGFPKALEIASKNADNQDLQKLLFSYYNQEVGHEEFVMKALLETGLKRSQVETSVPLVSTQNIVNLLCSIFTDYPWVSMYIAKVIEESDYSSDSTLKVCNTFKQNYDIDYDPLSHIFEHARIDYELGHFFILDNNKHLINTVNKENISDVFNRIHDIKHAFDLQKLEIIDYYSHIGNYFPRQKVDYFGV